MKTIVFVSGSRTGHNFIINQVRSWFPSDMQPKMVNYENILAKDYQRTLHAWIEAGQIDDEFQIIPVLIIRDLLNWWASYLNFVPNIAQRNWQNMFDVWTSHVSESAGLTNHIPNKIIVNYDGFNKRDFVREHLCDAVGGLYSENRIDEVLDAGKGSSFDGLKIPGRKMQTDIRYKQMQSNIDWLRMLWENRQAVELYNDNFTLSMDQKLILKEL